MWPDDFYYSWAQTNRRTVEDWAALRSGQGVNIAETFSFVWMVVGG